MSALSETAGQEGMLVASIGGTAEARDAISGGTMAEPGAVMVEGAMTALDAQLKGAPPAGPEIKPSGCTAFLSEGAIGRLNTWMKSR